MRVLFIHQNFPGQFLHIAQHLAHTRGWRVVGLGDAQNVRAGISGGVQVVGYKHQVVDAKGHAYVRGFEGQIRRGQTVFRAVQELKRQGFVPDLICMHPSWGEGIFLRQVFPRAKILGYFEFFYKATGSDVGFDPEFPQPSIDDLCRLRIRNSTHLLSLEDTDWGWSPTRWQVAQFPEAFRSRIEVVHDGIDTDRVCASPSAVVTIDGIALSRASPVVTFVARNLEPYRGFHSFMRAVPGILSANPDAHVVVVGGDEVSYGKPPLTGGTWRDRMLAELGQSFDRGRLHFAGRISYDRYLEFLRISRAHVYLTYPFVLSWSMLEAMAVGCAIVGSRTAPVEEVIRDGENGLLVDFFSPHEIVMAVGRILDDAALGRDLGQAARATILERYDLNRICLPAQLAMVDRVLAS